MSSNCHKRQKIENKYRHDSPRGIEALTSTDVFGGIKPACRTNKYSSRIEFQPNDKTKSNVTSGLMEIKNDNRSSIFTTHTSQNIYSLDSNEDIFFNVMHYFVSESGAVDVGSMNRIMRVSRRWYQLSTSRRLWRNTPKLQHTPQRRGMTPIFRTIHTKSKVSTIEKRLFGFCKLAKISNQSTQLCYKVKERSTGKIYRLNMTRLDAGKEQGYRSENLREIMTLSKLGRQNATTYECNHSYLSLLIDWDICDGYRLEWHTYTNSSLKSCLANEELNASQIKYIILQILSGIKELHSRGMIMHKLSIENILLNSIGENYFVYINNFSFSRSLAQPVEGNNEGNELSGTIFDAPEMLMNQQEYGTLVDVWSIGCIFAEMILSCKNDESHHSEINSDPYKSRCIPIYYASLLKDRSIPFDDTGMDLLEKLLCSNPKHRITATDAMKHSFFDSDKSSMSRYIARYSDDLGDRFGRLKNLEYICLDINDNRQHIKSEQWAMLVDWLFEIICVFEKSTQIVFMAMGFVDQYFSITKMKSKNLQLLAATCLHIASKCIDDTFMTSPDLAYCADNKFDGMAITDLEERILGKMYCQQLSFPTVYDFVILFLERLQETIVRDRQFWLSLYISELSLQTSIYLKFSPSLIAASVVALARHSIGENIAWPATLEQMTGFKLSTLKECIIVLSAFIDLTRASLPKLKIISRRYNSISRKRVSEIRVKWIRSASDVIAMNR